MEILRESSELLPNYVSGLTPGLNENLDEKFFSVANPDNAPELVSVAPNNDIVHLYDEDKSQSSYISDQSQFPSSGGKEIKKIIPTYVGSDLYLIATFEDKSVRIAVKENGRGEWHLVQISDENLSAMLARLETVRTFVGSKGQVFIYGFTSFYTPSSFILVELQAGGVFELVYAENPTKASLQYVILPDTDSDNLTLATVDKSIFRFRQLKREGDKYVLSGFDVQKDLGLGDINISSVFPLYYGKNSSLLLLDMSGRLFLIDRVASEQSSGKILNPQGLGPEVISQVSIGYDSNNLLDVYCIEKGNQVLWILTEDPSSESFGFANWFPLGDQILTLSAPGKSNYGSQLFHYGVDRKIRRLHQAETTGLLFTEEVLGQPVAEEAKKNWKSSNTFLHEFVFKKSDTGKEETLVKVSSDRNAYLVIQELGFQVSPDQPVTVELNFLNRLTIYSTVTTLSAPVLTISTADGESVGFFRSDHSIYEKLSGNVKGFVVNGQTMKDAGVIPDSVPDDKAEDTANTVKAIARHVLDNGNKTGSAAQSFTMEFRFHEDGTFTSSSEISPEVISLINNTELGSLEDIFGKVIHSIKQGFRKIGSFVIHIVGGVFHLVIDGLLFVVDNLEQAAETIVAFLKKVGGQLLDKLLEKIAEWLRALLHLNGAVNIELVASNILNQTLDYLSGEFSDELPNKVIDFFKGIENKIEDYFTILEKNIDPHFQVGNFSGKDKNFAGVPSFNKMTQDLGFLSSSGQMYISKFFNMANSFGLDNVIDYNKLPDSPFNPQDIIDGIAQVLPVDKIENSIANLTKLFSKHSENVGEVVIITLLEAVKDIILLVLSVVEEIVLFIFKVISYGIDSMKVIMNLEVNIPIIGDFFKFITGTKPTLINILTFIVGVPCNLVYRAIKDKDIFSDSDVREVENLKIPFPDFMNSDSLKPRNKNELSLSDNKNLETEFAWLGLILGVGAGVTEGINDIIASSEDAGISEKAKAGFEIGGSILSLSAISAVLVSQSVFAATDEKVKKNKADQFDITGPPVVGAVVNLISLGFVIAIVKFDTSLFKKIDLFLRTTGGSLWLTANIVATIAEFEEGSLNEKEQTGVVLSALLSPIPLMSSPIVPVTKKLVPELEPVAVVVKAFLDIVGEIAPGIGDVVLVSE